VREQLVVINELEAADNRRGQELEVIRADRRDLIRSYSNAIVLVRTWKGRCPKRLDRHRQVLNR